MNFVSSISRTLSKGVGRPLLQQTQLLSTHKSSCFIEMNKSIAAKERNALHHISVIFRRYSSILTNSNSSSSCCCCSSGRLRSNSHVCSRISSLRSNSSLSSLLNESHIAIISKQRDILSELRSTIQSLYNFSQDEVDLITDTQQRMDDLFMMVVVGEYNSGKSTFINSLLGEKYLQDGVIPTTAKICILRQQQEDDIAGQVGVWKSTKHFKFNDVQEMDLPLEWLKHIAIVDTPGTNATIEAHEELTQKIIPRSDLVLFVTSADRPICASEAKFLEKIVKWGKKVIVVINKIDNIQSESDKAKIINYVSQNVSSILGSSINSFPIFAISARYALNSKLVSKHNSKGRDDPSLGPGAREWEQSNMAELENHLRGILSKEDFINEKLQNALVVADRLVTSALVSVDSNIESLDGDLSVIDMIDEYMERFREELKEEVSMNKKLSNDILSQTNRFDRFINEISVFNNKLILDPLEFTSRFRSEVSVDISEQVIDAVNDICESVSSKSKDRTKTVHDYIGDFPKKYQDVMMGKVNINFAGLRKEFSDRLLRDLNAEIKSYNASLANTTKKLSDSLQNVFYGSATCAGAAILTTAAVNNLLNDNVAIGQNAINIFTLVATLAVGGGISLLLPSKKRRLKEEYEVEVNTLKTKLENIITNHVKSEISLISNRIFYSISPYTDYVKSTKLKSEQTKKKLLSIRSQINSMKEIAKK